MTSCCTTRTLAYVINRAGLVVLTTVLAACPGNDPVQQTSSAEGDGSGTSGSTTAPTTTAPTTSAEGTQSATDDPTGTSNTSPTTTTTATESTTADTTSASTGATDDATITDTSSPSTSVADDESSSDGGEPAVHHLSNSDQTDCTQPLWCQFNADVTVPGGDPIEGQECFVSPIAPPFELFEMHYIVATTHTDLEEFSLRIYERDGGPPTEVVVSIPLTSVEATPIEHYFDIDPPVTIDTQEFCVGFAAEEPGLESAIGMAVDGDSSVAGVSFVRMEGSGDCDIPDWEDATDHAPPPAGNWCMDATIRELR